MLLPLKLLRHPRQRRQPGWLLTPPFATMIAAAIKKLGDRKGSPCQAILKAGIADNKVDAANLIPEVTASYGHLLLAPAVVTHWHVAGKLPT